MQLLVPYRLPAFLTLPRPRVSLALLARGRRANGGGIRISRAGQSGGRHGRALADAFAPARRVFEEVDAALAEGSAIRSGTGRRRTLILTENAQPALMAVSLAVLRVLETEAGVDLGRDAAFVAGHSLGEYSALAAAGAITVADAARLLRIRGRAMQTAVPVGVGAMAALIGVEFSEAEAIAAEAAGAGSAQRRMTTAPDRSSCRARSRQWSRPSRLPRGKWRETGDDAAGVCSVPLLADAAGRRRDGRGAREGRGRSRRACRSSPTSWRADQRSGEDRAMPGRAGDRHRSLAEIGPVMAQPGVTRLLRGRCRQGARRTDQADRRNGATPPRSVRPRMSLGFKATRG